ncbi:MAG: S-layer homology domain-containing protein, partial [Candidatus Parabeggiatoa sp.]|nr:S-layer homology domain-containing protein [Candidatus Parabeggiatoa sp.]
MKTTFSFFIFVSFFVYLLPAHAVNNVMCIGNNYEQQEIATHIFPPLVGIDSKLTSVKEGAILVLNTNYRIDTLSGGTPSFYWCTDQGSLEADSQDYHSVRFVAPSVPENGATIRISVWMGDNLGYIDKDTISIRVLDDPILSSIVINTNDKATGNIELISRGMTVHINTVSLVKVNGQEINGTWNDEQLNKSVSQKFINNSINLEIQEITGLTSENIEQPVHIEAYDYFGAKVIDAYYPFIDVAPNLPYTMPVLTLWKEGAIEGYQHPDRRGHFGPNNNATRAEFLKATLKATDPDRQYPLPSTKPFEDVEITDWFAGYIQYAKENGIVTGCHGGTDFCPNDSITKAEAAKIIVESLDKCHELFNAFLQGSEPSRIFLDVTNPFTWYYPYIYTLTESDIVDGYDDGSFKPHDFMTRAKMAEMIYTAVYGSSECVGKEPPIPEDDFNAISFDQASGTVQISVTDPTIDLTTPGTSTLDGQAIQINWTPDSIAFNLYETTGKTFDTFWQPVKLEIHDAKGQAIYSGCYPFKDVCAYRWYTRSVLKLWKEAIIQGYSDGKSSIFGTNNSALRAELVVAVVRALEQGNTPEPLTTSPFTDVSINDWFAPYMQYAKDMGLIEGCDIDKTLFCPGDSINRAAATKIIVAAFLNDTLVNFEKGKQPSSLFPDVTDPTEWFYPYIYAAQAKKVVQGYPDGYFKPTQTMTRAEMAKALCIAAFGPAECIDTGPENRPMIFAITPLTATVNEPITFTLEGFNLPIPVTLALPDCANLTPVSGGTAEKQDFQCTPTLAGLKNATVNAPDGTVLVEFAVEVDEISTPPPPPSCTPSVTAVSPLTAVLNQTQVFTVKGLCLPETTVFSIAECDNLARLDGDEQQQPFRCLPNSSGDKQGVVKDQPEGTVLHDFTVSVTEDSTPTTPTPLEGDGLIHDKYRPGDATKLFILNEKMTTTCTFSDVAPSPEFAEAVNALCSAGILVGYWENDERVFIKLHPAKVDPNNPSLSRKDPANLMTKAILAEILKVFLFALDYDYFGVRHVNDSDWYKLFIDEAKNRGLELHDLAYNNHVTRGQAMTWLAQLFYDYTDSDPSGFLKTQGITTERLDDVLTRYELAALTYNAILDTGKTDEIHFGLFDAPAPKLPSSNFGQSVANQALAAVGQTYPYVDSQYTYSARFVRTQFEKRVHWPDAKSLCQHYDDLGVMATSETPPAGAVICYLPAETNWDYGHVAIAIGDGTEIGVTSL